MDDLPARSSATAPFQYTTASATRYCQGSHRIFSKKRKAVYFIATGCLALARSEDQSYDQHERSGANFVRREFGDTRGR
jgi:hypothetical protein